MSAVASVSTPGVWVTTTSCAAAASRSMLSIPTAYWATIRRSGHAAKTRSVTGSASTVSNTSASLANSMSSSSDRAAPAGGSQTVTVCASRSSASPSSIRGRVTTTCAMTRAVGSI